MEETKKEFPEGVYFSKPRENAPDFIKGHVALSEGIVEYYNSKKNAKGYVNLDLKMSKGGKLYLDLNDWTPDEKKEDEGDSNPF